MPGAIVDPLSVKAAGELHAIVAGMQSVLDHALRQDVQEKLGRIFSAGNEAILRTIHDGLAVATTTLDDQRKKLLDLLAQLEM